MRYFSIVQSTQDGTVHKNYPLDGLTKIQAVETLVSQFSIVPVAIRQVAIKVIELPYLPHLVVCGLTMLRGARHKPEDILCPIWASMSSKHFHNIIRELLWLRKYGSNH